MGVAVTGWRLWERSASQTQLTPPQRESPAQARTKAQLQGPQLTPRAGFCRRVDPSHPWDTRSL